MLQPRLTVVRKLSHAAAAAAVAPGGGAEGTSMTLGSSGGSSMPLPPGAYNPADGDLPSGESQRASGSRAGVCGMCCVRLPCCCS